MDASNHGLPGSAEKTGLAPRPGERLDKALARTSDAPLREGNRLELLKNGPHTYDDWLAAIARARRWVHLDNYIFQNDTTGKRFAEALTAKAAEGVRVRVLHYWFGCMDVPRSFWQGFQKAGMEVRAVNPPTLGAPLGVIRRDHRKLLAVDGEYASTGGVCISDGWLVRSPETGLAYRDTAVSVLGPAVADVDQAFAAVWDETGEALPEDERPRAEDIAPAGEQAVRVVVQEPRKMRTLRLLQLLTAGAEGRLWITDAYFLSMPILTQALMATARDGVDVRVLVPATNDIPWIGRASRAGYRQFLESGVRIFEYGGPMIHAKTLVADGRFSKVGSTNLNFSSLAANWEIDLVAEDTGFAAQMERLFEEDLAYAREVRLVGSHREVRPDHRVDTSNRGARRGVVGSALAPRPPSSGWVALRSRRAALPCACTSTPSLQRPAPPCWGSPSSVSASPGSSPGRWRPWAPSSEGSGWCAPRGRRASNTEVTTPGLRLRVLLGGGQREPRLERVG